MKKNIIKRLAVLSLALAVCTTALMSGTMAKYTSTVEGEGSTEVAKFDFKINAGYKSGTMNSRVPLADATTVLDLFQLRMTDSGVNGIDYVAPGTFGQFQIYFENNSDVLVEDTYILEETNSNELPIVYTFVNADGEAYYYSNVLTGEVVIQNGLEAPAYNQDTIMIKGDVDMLAQDISDYRNYFGFKDTDPATPERYETYTINWFWAYESADTATMDFDPTDVTDTGIGFDTADGRDTSDPMDDVTLALRITGTATQLDVMP